MKLHFLGANRQVTGSRYLLEADGVRVMIDCGMFQERDFLDRNWEPSPVPPNAIDCLLLTHAHLDHVGLIPRLVQQGFNKPILTTPASRDIAEIILKDAAGIQEEDAAFKRKRHAREGRSGPREVVPLYTTADAVQALPLFQTVPYDQPRSLNGDVTVTFRDAGHILGSAILEVRVGRGASAKTIVFSGDIGQMNKPIIRNPTLIDRADYVVMESTYGDRNHKDGRAVEDQLADAINTAAKARGNVIIPTFAVERAQELTYHIGHLLRDGRIPRMPAFLDSPMAADVTEVFRRHHRYMDDEARRLIEAGQPLMRFPGLRMVRSTEDSKAINRFDEPCIIMSTNGMCTAGRIKHHLANNVSDQKNVLLFVGFQAIGTLGRELVSGKSSVRIHGVERPVRARVCQIYGLSAHADRDDLLHWIGHFNPPPKRVFLTHGEEDAANALADTIRARQKCDVTVPAYKDEVQLD